MEVGRIPITEVRLFLFIYGSLAGASSDGDRRYDRRQAE